MAAILPGVNGRSQHKFTRKREAVIIITSLWNRLIRFGFRLLYNELAWTYDLVSWLVSLGAWREWQRAALPHVQGERVLELGHGPGHMLLALQLAGHEAVGLDLSRHMGQLARRRVPSVPLLRGCVQQLPFATAVFETVLATFPTEYVVDPETLREVHRVLAANGRFVIVPEGHLTGRGPLHRFIEWLFYLTGQRTGAFATEAAVWQPFLERFRQAGFTVRRQRQTLPGSSVTVIVCAKRPLPPT